MKVLFRTDASQQIGSGHVMRCLTLAQALRDQGAKCSFICRQHPGHMLKRIRQAGFEAIALPMEDKSYPLALPEYDPVAHAHWLGSDWQTDSSQTIAALKNHQPDWLIVDHYAIDQKWESQLRRFCRKIMVIDDLADRKHDCDLLLDQNLVKKKHNRYDSLIPSPCVRLLGPRYALLQPQYAELHRHIPPRTGPVKRILVYFGGSDKKNLTGQAVAVFLALKRGDILLDVVISPDSPHVETLQKQVKRHDNIKLHKELQSLAHLMAQADLAIGASGTTSWERCCLNLPALIVTLAENQNPIADELARLGVVRLIGKNNIFNKHTLYQEIKKIINDNSQSFNFLKFRSITSIDGYGSRRVVAKLIKISFKKDKK